MAGAGGVGRRGGAGAGVTIRGRDHSGSTRETSPAEEAGAALRRSLLDQLAYLIDELEAQTPLLGRVPEALLEARPLPDVWSVKERYGLLAAMDEIVHSPVLERMAGEEEPVLEVPEPQALVHREAWNSNSIGALVGRIQAARRAVLAALADLPEAGWERTAVVGGERQHVYAFVHRIVQHDADVLRAVGHLLFERRSTQGAPRAGKEL